MIFKNKYNEVRSGWKILLVFLLSCALTFGASMLIGVIIGIIFLIKGNADSLMNFNIESTAEYELIFQISTSISNILLIISPTNHLREVELLYLVLLYGSYLKKRKLIRWV